MKKIKNQFIQKPCETFLKKDLISKNQKIDLAIFSPPYNIGRSYDKYKDSRSRKEYMKWMVNLFRMFENVLAENRVVLINLSYSTKDPILPFEVITEISRNTEFRLADTINWEKPNCTPLSSGNRLDRIFEYVFVMARENELKTFHINRKITKIGKNGVVYRSPIRNKLYCKNGKSIEGNISTFSVDLITELIKLYGKTGDLIYDPFMGSGTTGIASLLSKCNFVGTEISQKQIEVSYKRLIPVSRYVKLRYLLSKVNDSQIKENFRVEKLHHRKEENSVKAKYYPITLKNNTVEKIKELLSKGQSTSAIRKIINVEYGEEYSAQRIHSIKTLRSYPKVREELNEKIVSFLPKLSFEKEKFVGNIKRKIVEGYDRDYICELYGISFNKYYTIHGLKGQSLTIDKHLNEGIRNKKKLNSRAVYIVKHVYTELESKFSYKIISDETGLSIQEIVNILTLKKHRNIGKKYNDTIKSFNDSRIRKLEVKYRKKGIEVRRKGFESPGFLKIA
jgi:DNA modification methylase